MGFFLRIKLLLGAMVLTLALCASAQQSTKKAASPSPVKSAASEGTQPKFKAIWEPVNVKEDIELLSAYFVSPEEGWVAGGRTVLQGGVIPHTKDAGANWEVQLWGSAVERSCLPRSPIPRAISWMGRSEHWQRRS